MRRVFYGLVILIVVAIVAIGGGAYYLANMEFDFKDQEKVAKFNETYVENCVGRYKQQLTKAGMPPTDEQLVAANAACKCARDPIVAAFAKRPVMTIAQIAEAIDKDPEITAITKSCAEAAGISAPQ
jgi:hypothetical protein